MITFHRKFEGRIAQWKADADWAYGPVAWYSGRKGGAWVALPGFSVHIRVPGLNPR